MYLLYIYLCTILEIIYVYTDVYTD